MKSIPPASLLADPLKREFINRILNDVNMTLQQYIDSVINRTMVKPKQILTDLGLQLLKQPQHQLLLIQLKKQYPMFITNGIVILLCSHTLINNQYLFEQFEKLKSKREWYQERTRRIVIYLLRIA